MSDKKRLLVVFDIDETLLHFLPKKFIGNTNWKQLSAEEKAQFNNVAPRDDHAVLLRPYLCELFRFFNANQDKYAVALWTYSEQEYAEDIAGMISKHCGLPSDFFLFKWGYEQIQKAKGGEDYPKNLNMVWGNFTDFNKFNTIIVDDDYNNIKHEHNVENCIFIQPYAPFGRSKSRMPMTQAMLDKALNDDALQHMQTICETVSRDIQGCENTDVEDAFCGETVFSPKRINRMGLGNYLKKYAIKFMMLPSIGEGYQTNNFIDVTDQAERYGDRQHGGKNKRTRKHKKSRKSKRNIKSKKSRKKIYRKKRTYKKKEGYGRK
jgi:hypothetical protein